MALDDNAAIVAFTEGQAAIPVIMRRTARGIPAIAAN
jgi:hypothetical protein